MSGRGRICIYSDYLFPVLVPTGVPFAGGAETQLARIAWGLHARGFEVSVVTGGFGQPAEVVFRGLRVLKSFAPEAGWPVFRFFHPRLTGMLGALNRADAEVYYVNGAGLTVGLTGELARMRRAGFVNHCASDYDVSRAGLGQHLSLRDRSWHLRSIRRADALLAQTEWQRAHFKSQFGLASEVLPNLVQLPAVAADPGQDGAVVWIGTYKKMKRPDWFLRLAEDCPGARFVMAGVIPPAPLTREHWERARATSERLPNLEVRGFQNEREIAELLSGASLLVHTSPVEGFSNVLLEAWAKGVPTVSCVDPDGVVGRERLGRAAPDYPALLAAVRELLADPAERRAAGQRARQLVASRHAPDAVFDQLATLLDGVVAAVRTRRAR